MKEMIIKHRRFGLAFSIRRNVPESWNELTARQFCAVAAMSGGNITEYDFFRRFFGLPKRVMADIDPYLLLKISETLEFLRSREVWGNVFFLPRIGALVAPHAKLQGMSMVQFMAVDTYFSWYAATKREEYIDRMVASLYLKRSEDFTGENGKTPDFDRRTKAVRRHIDRDTKTAVMLNWSLVRMWLARTYPYLFPGSAGEESVAAKPKPAQWLALFDSFVGDNIAGIDAYKKLPCMDAFRILNRRIHEAQKRKP